MLGHRYPRPSKSGVINSISCVSANTSIPSTQPPNPSSRKLSRSSYSKTADPIALQQLAWQQLESLRQQQASALAYFDVFWMIAVLTFAVAFLVLLMKRSVAEKRSHVGVE